MATMNPFDLLGDDDNEDPSQLIAAAQLKVVDKPKKASAPAPAQAQAQPVKPAKLPTKPPAPAQAVREARTEGGREGGRGGGRGPGRGRGGGGFNRERGVDNNETAFGSNNGYKPSEDGEGGKPSIRRSYPEPRGAGFRGGRRGGFSNDEAGEGQRPRRLYERRSGTGRGNELKREGAGRGNWGTPTDEIAPETEESVVENEKNIGVEKPQVEDDATDANKDSPTNEPEEKEPEDKEMTLEEYEKIIEEKKKALLVSKTEDRKVDVEKEFGAMLQLSSKKGNDEIFIKLGSEKDKRKDAADKEERAKKAVNINEFLKTSEGDRYHGGRGRGRGRGPRGGYGGGNTRDAAAPSIEDPGQFPTLGGK